jgi:hypothetical protein
MPIKKSFTNPVMFYRLTFARQIGYAKGLQVY